MINFLDSPGHSDFQGGIALGLEFADVLVLVISANEGYQARTYWLNDIAKEKNLPLIIAATKMDLPTANVAKIKKELENMNRIKIPIIETSARNQVGMEDLINKISIYVKHRGHATEELEFIILGYTKRKGLGDLLSIGIKQGRIETNQWLTDKIKIRNILSLKNSPQKEATEGEIVHVLLNIDAKYDLGTRYFKGKFISPKIEGILADINPRKEFHITIENSEQYKIAIEVLENIKKILPSFDYYTEKNNIITILVLGDLQFDFIKERLEDLMEFKIISSKIKGIVTINSSSHGKYNSANVRINPRCRKKLTVARIGSDATLFDILGASAAKEAFHLDGLHVDILSGKNEDDIAQAIAKAIEKVKIIKIIPHQDVIVKVDKYHDLFPLIERFNIEVLHQTQSNSFFLQVKNQEFESFFNSLMKISKGRADINLFKFEQEDVILSVDPGTRHYGFCLIQKGEMPSLWHVNLKKTIDDQRAHSTLIKQIEQELQSFLGNDKEIINKIFIGDGPGSRFIADFFIKYFNIPCDEYSCIISDFSDYKEEKQGDNNKNRFEPPEIFLVDEFKTTKEALFHLQQGKLVNEVQSKGFVDHAIAALLIAKRGLKGEIIKIDKKPLKQLHDYIIDTYSGSFSFGTIHNVNNLDDLRPGMYLRVKDSTKLDSNLSNGDIISFSGFGNSYNSIHGRNLSGNNIIVKFQGNVKIKRDFFKILVPVKERT